MVVDTSALFEIVAEGAEAEAMRAAIRRGRGHCFISAATLVEAYVALRRRYGVQNGPKAATLLLRIVRRYGIAVEAFQATHADIAMTAFARFGLGAGGGALNFGDCFAYALAKERNDTLLFVGEDFRRTDIRPAL